MTFRVHEDLLPVLTALAQQPVSADLDFDDPATIRAMTDGSMAAMAQPLPASVVTRDHDVAVDGGSVLARWYQKQGDQPGSAIVYLHGGGMVAGRVELFDPIVASLVDQTGVPALSVDYRLAPEHPGEVATMDALAALKWMIDHAAELGVDPARIAVMGDSAGGGVAASLAIAARDAGIPLKQQILIYPMLDDRTVDPDPELVPYAGWTYQHNRTGWTAKLGDMRGTDDVSPLAAPARLVDFTGLAPAFIEVGELDIFRDEDIRYALALYKAGVSTELIVRPGAIHGFDLMASAAPLGALSRADRERVITSL